MMSSVRRPFFTYFGGKWRAAKRYPVPEYDTIVEPFAGSAGYSLRYPHKKVILVERDERVAGLWEYLIKASTLEIASLPDVTLDQTVDDLNVCQEAKWLIGFWLNKGTSSPCKMPGAWMRSGKHSLNNFWGFGTKMTLASQVDLIKHWRVIHGDYSMVPNNTATWFIDPPYKEAGKDYRYGSSKIDYSRLAEWCASRQGQVIVCENKGADWLPFSHFTDIKGTPGKNRSGVSSEVIWQQNRVLPEWLVLK